MALLIVPYANWGAQSYLLAPNSTSQFFTPWHDTQLPRRVMELHLNCPFNAIWHNSSGALYAFQRNHSDKLFATYF
jgi:hypothetical protein